MAEIIPFAEAAARAIERRATRAPELVWIGYAILLWPILPVLLVADACLSIFRDQEHRK